MKYNTLAETQRAQTPSARSTGSRLINLFSNAHLSPAQKTDAAYKIVRESAPDLNTNEYLQHARILITAARNAAAENVTAGELKSAAAEAIRAHFPNATEIF